MAITPGWNKCGVCEHLDTKIERRRSKTADSLLRIFESSLESRSNALILSILHTNKGFRSRQKFPPPTTIPKTFGGRLPSKNQLVTKDNSNVHVSSLINALFPRELPFLPTID